MDDKVPVNGDNLNSGGQLMRATFQISPQLLAEARGAVATLGGPPLHLTLARLFRAALRRHLTDLRRTHNSGLAFPLLPTLPAGRPRKT